ncbi:ubiquitin carboxyl-terminal hydrolase Usp2 isoform X1 [Drosophila ficusphila]|uniref:ubiquitin carboxyl-terminal hydrolase Usp2 isoform X1 n=1 Tax=Drosophila ficusphila TaxID=30025 RepID=UPI0007E8A093|nr:ubiquitin carboxyl-terminal hydrolase Usp2 isoform X1 [Drosophila ficusphila]
MMLDIKKTKSQPATRAVSSVVATSEHSAASVLSAPGGNAGNATSSLSGRGAGSLAPRLKNPVQGKHSSTVPGGSVAVGKTHAALAAAKYGGGGGVATQARSTPAAATTSSQSNPVRAANERYFLVSSYKDPTFLKAECELAHALVAASKVKTTASQGHQRSRAGEDSRNNNHNSHNGHSGSRAPTLVDMRRAPMFNGNQQATTSSSSTTINNTTSSNSNSSSSSGRNATGNGVLKYSARSTAGAAGTATTSTSTRSFGKLKPLNNNQTAAAMTNGHATTTNNNNNSAGSSSNLNNGGGNNNMHRQQQQQQQQQHDDISYIDSDDPPATGGPGGPAGGASAAGGATTKSSICYFKPITPPLQLRQQRTSQAQHQQQEQPGGSKVGSHRYPRPKSTIIASAHSNFAASYEKFSGGGYRQTNGEVGDRRSESRNSGSSNARKYGIDSLSIKASIEKFNSLSGQKRQTGVGSGSGVVTAPGSGSGAGSGLGSGAGAAAGVGSGSGSGSVAGAGGGTDRGRNASQGGGSSGNLQQRYSSDLDNIRVAAGYSSSLTRAAYRTTATMNSVSTPATAAATSSSALRGPIGGGTATAVVSPISKVRGAHSSSRPPSECDGLASMTSKVNNDAAAAAAAATSGVVASASATPATSSVSTATGTATATATVTATVTATASASASSSASDSTAARSGTGSSSSARGVLPPMTPTSSRYWDRDSGTSRSSASSSSALNSSSLKHNSDDGYKSASSSRNEKSEGLCGLRNIGNTCFMNSVIQCLSHTQELTRFLRSHHGSRSSSTKDQQILHEFAKLIQEMWTSNVHTVTPMELKRAFSTKHRMYSDYNQQDAQEFLRFFLDSLHSALNSGVKGETLNIDDNLSDNKKADLTWEWYTRHENSLVRDLFVGQLKSTLKCTTCGNTSVTFDPFWDLSVPLPSSSRCKLEACLDLFIREEVLDGDEMPTCAKCKTRRKCTKSFTIQRFPKYLVIHLKRFSETRWSKLSNIVEFPTSDSELNMGSYGANSNSNVHYSLYAISNHMGSTAGGHYVALCKHPVSRKWHEFNDNIVSDALSENHLVSSSAYILFYERA